MTFESSIRYDYLSALCKRGTIPNHSIFSYDSKLISSLNATPPFYSRCPSIFNWQHGGALKHLPALARIFNEQLSCLILHLTSPFAILVDFFSLLQSFQYRVGVLNCLRNMRTREHQSERFWFSWLLASNFPHFSTFSNNCCLDNSRDCFRKLWRRAV